MKRIFILAGVLLPALAFAQLSGRVINERNQGVPFATVKVKNGGETTSSDSTGRFSLLRPEKFPFTLVVSSVGYRSHEVAVKDSNANNLLVLLEGLFQQDTVIITSRRRREALQDVPIAISVIGGGQIDDAGAFNVTRIKEVIPSVQMYTSNPRNTGVNIRGIGSPFGLTNDGLDPGVGFYIDGVYISRDPQ
ncbi:MAG: TonB-dependent receptor [Chitinophagaceae bacterium]|nr:TonB-dependent receptor [Chitinophagaceae bacterium]